MKMKLVISLYHPAGQLSRKTQQQSSRGHQAKHLPATLQALEESVGQGSLAAHTLKPVWPPELYKLALSPPSTSPIPEWSPELQPRTLMELSSSCPRPHLK